MENLLMPFQADTHIPCHRAIVLAPHPDDEVFGCGGAIMRHVARGETVQVVIVTDGAFDTVSDTPDYSRQRQLESMAAADILGYGEPVFWHYPDRALRYGERLVGEIIAVIEAYRADLVYAPSVFEMHPDHRALGMAAMEAVRRMGSSLRLAAYEVGIPLMPNLLLDISDLAERKQAAMRCFVSQNEKQRYDLDIAALNRYRTYTLPASVTAAEAYVLVTAEMLLHDPFKLYRSEHARQRVLGLPLESRDVPLISVIIRSMDRPALSDALDSVALQTYPNIEVVVVNAKGRPHRSLDAWCGRFPLRKVDEGQPLGRSQAANAGLKAARGEFLIFLDDDDEFLPHHIARLKAELDHSDHAIAAYSAISCVDESGQEIQRLGEQFDPVRLRINNYIPIHAVLFRRRVIDQGSCFDVTLRTGENWDFWLQLLEYGEFRFVPEIGALYCIGCGKNPGIWQDADLTQGIIASVYLKWMPRWDRETLRTFINRVRNEETVAVLGQEVADLRKKLDEVHQVLDSQDRQLKICHEEVRFYQQQLVERERQLQVILNSKSWKLTEPLRVMIRFLSRVMPSYRRTPAE
jgi:LmbE family N-acetylglucosaminyl deacetylase/glycosyltransferase involved in cell wall biosynthesis